VIKVRLLQAPIPAGVLFPYEPIATAIYPATYDLFMTKVPKYRRAWAQPGINLHAVSGGVAIGYIGWTSDRVEAPDVYPSAKITAGP
jgi:hypothetical protein